ncbi:growth/differentiation factor 10 [Lampris incognitus]|uniref:growth/differentiation factor 10 n=1 Tax=Lampris incognitus TaxID=2546036 RepID=UPI0024B4DF20|nr:growth/differentiation factor 10 [Lampris incognitus]
MSAPSLSPSHLFILVLSCYLAATSARITKRSWHSAQDGASLQPPSDLYADGLDRDALRQHMGKLYEKCRRGNRLSQGNTVRGFTASQGSSDQRTVYLLNLTSLQDSEVILSGTFHFLFDRHPRQKAWFCKRFKSPSCRSLLSHPLPSISLHLRSVPPGPGISSESPGSLLGNVTFHPRRRGAWQMKDVTQVIKQAQDRGHLLLSVEMEFGQQYQRQPKAALPAGALPYLLLFADDRALTEPNSVAASLQRYDPFPEGGEALLSSVNPNSNSSPETRGRVRREAALPSGPIQNNELPDADYRPSGFRKDDLWESTWQLTFKPKSKLARKEKKRRNQGAAGVEKDRQVYEGEGPRGSRDQQRTSRVSLSDETPVKKSDNKYSRPLDGSDRPGEEGRNEGRKHRGRGGGAQPESPVLSFDERTMRKARRRQWGDHQNTGCSRRNLRVDFADIGWSEWVIAPKAFDAYYCAGTCGFPMPKVAQPSNHATIQSIVRAVGIIPGVPEPCCVPDKMGPLAVLYQDDAHNPVLKVYPNMSVRSCSCR